MPNSNSFRRGLAGWAKYGAPIAIACSAATAASAEPAAHLMYVKPETGECGIHITGYAESTGATETRVIDRAFMEFHKPTTDALCGELLKRISPPQNPLRGQPCAELDALLSGDVERNCQVLGFRYVGVLPATSTQCYPRLGAILGNACPPEVWFRLGALVAALVSMLAIGRVIAGKRRQKLRAWRETDVG